MSNYPKTMMALVAYSSTDYCINSAEHAQKTYNNYSNS